MSVLATVAGDAIADAGKAVDVARGASGWLHTEGGYALAVVFLVAWIMERVLGVLQRRRADDEIAKKDDALGRARDQMTSVFVELLRHERDADDTPPPKT